MKKELKYEDILENIDELNERLEDLETSDPYFYWKVMDTAAYITDKGSLFEVNKDKYNALITNYKKIILNKPFPEDEEDWTEDGYKVIETKNLLADNAVKYIQTIESNDKFIILIDLLSELSLKDESYISQKHATLSNIYSNLDITDTNSDLNESLMASLCQTSQKKNNKQVNNLIIGIRNKIQNLKLYINLIHNNSVHFKQVETFKRCLEFNELYWQTVINNDLKINKDDLMININQIGILSNSENNTVLSPVKDIDKLPEIYRNNLINNLADQQIKNYVIEMYFRKILIQAEEDTDKLLSAYRMHKTIQERRLDKYYNKIGLIINSSHQFNTNDLLEKGYKNENDKILKNISFKSINKSIYRKSDAIQHELMSFIYTHYPEDLFNFLVNNIQNKYFGIKILNNEIKYAINLINNNKDYDSERFSTSISHFMKNKLITLPDKEFASFFSNNSKFLIRLNKYEFTKNLSYLIKNNQFNLSKMLIINDYFLLSLVNIEDTYNIYKYKDVITILLSYQNKNITSKLFGFFAIRSSNQFVNHFTESITLNSLTKDIKLFNFYYLAQFSKLHYSKFDDDVKSKIYRSFIKNIDNTNEEIRYVSFANAIYFNDGFTDNKKILKLFNKNLNRKIR